MHGNLQEISEQALDYLLGDLAGEARRNFDQRLVSGCPHCMSEALQHSETLSAVAMSAPCSTPPPSLREKLLARVEAEAGASPMKIVPADASPWWPGPVPGVELRFLNGRKTFLVRMAPGSSLPLHHHDHAEQCLVLEGSVHSEGATVRAGDYIYMPAGSTHQPIHTEEGCTFLIAYS